MDIILLKLFPDSYYNKGNGSTYRSYNIIRIVLLKFAGRNIAPYIGCPFHKIYEYRQEKGCEQEKGYHLIFLVIMQPQAAHCKTVNDRTEYKCTPITKAHADAVYTIFLVGLMLVHLG